MKTRSLALIAAVIAICSWAALGIADFNSLYKMEWNIPPIPADLTWPKFVRAHQDEFWRFLNPALLLVFFAPVAVIWAFDGFKKIQWVFFAGIVLLCAFDIAQLISFEGGDRKGCEGCFAWFLLQGMLCVISVFFVLWACAFRGVKALTPGRTDGS
jgi:hypothetical protein